MKKKYWIMVLNDGKHIGARENFEEAKKIVADKKGGFVYSPDALFGIAWRVHCSCPTCQRYCPDSCSCCTRCTPPNSK